MDSVAQPIGVAYTRTAIIVGASSGIGEALARQLACQGYRIGLAARRTGKLETLAAELGMGSLACTMDLANPAKACRQLEMLASALGGVDLVVLSAGVGHLNPVLDWTPDCETLAINVVGFAALGQAALKHFIERGGGHLVGISSVAKLKASGSAAAYCASKAFVSVYLDGLRAKAKASRLPITVTEICPGFVDTTMMKADKPFWVVSPAVAARCMQTAIERRASHAFVPRRWGLIAAVLRVLPR